MTKMSALCVKETHVRTAVGPGVRISMAGQTHIVSVASVAEAERTTNHDDLDRFPL